MPGAAGLAATLGDVAAEFGVHDPTEIDAEGIAAEAGSRVPFVESCGRCGALVHRQAADVLRGENPVDEAADAEVVGVVERIIDVALTAQWVARPRGRIGSRREAPPARSNR